MVKRVRTFSANKPQETACAPLDLICGELHCMFTFKQPWNNL